MSVAHPLGVPGVHAFEHPLPGYKKRKHHVVQTTSPRGCLLALVVRAAQQQYTWIRRSRMLFSWLWLSPCLLCLIAAARDQQVCEQDASSRAYEETHGVAILAVRFSPQADGQGPLGTGGKSEDKKKERNLLYAKPLMT